MPILRPIGALLVSFLMLAVWPSAGPTALAATSSLDRPAGEPPSPQGADSKNILRFAVHVSEMGKLDPHFAAASQDRTVADMVFNGLLRYIPGNAPAIEPDLAQEMPRLKMVKGRQVWTVKIRHGVMFHPGPKTPAYELTADDVVYSFAKAADPERSAYAGAYEGMAVNKIDNHTVEFALENPISSILFFPKLTNYNGGFIVSRKAIENMGYEAFQNHPVGTGPFMFKSYDPGTGLRLMAHDGYFRGRPALDGVHLHFTPDTEKRRAGLLAGDYDVIIGNGQKGFAKALLSHPGIAIDPHGPGEVTTLYFNTQIPPMDNLLVREAITHALNRKEFLGVYDENSAGPVFSPVPADFLPGGLTAQEVDRLGIGYKEDLLKARTLLSQAGYPKGFTLELVSSEKRTYRSFYGILKQQLARIGIDCRVTILPHSEMHKTIRKDPKPIVIYTAWRPNADVFLTRFFHSASILVTGQKPDTNFSGYAKVDKLIEDARLEIDPEKQISLWQQAQIKILNDRVAYPLIYAIMNTPRRSRVDYGHTLKASMALYPQFTENTKFLGN